MVKPSVKKKASVSAKGKNAVNESPSSESLSKKKGETDIPNSLRPDPKIRSSHDESVRSTSGSVHSLGEKVIHLTIESLDNMHTEGLYDTANIRVEFSDFISVWSPTIELSPFGDNDLDWQTDIQVCAHSLEDRKTLAKCPMVFTLTLEEYEEIDIEFNEDPSMLSANVSTTPSVTPNPQITKKISQTELKKEESKAESMGSMDETKVTVGNVIGYCNLDLMPLLVGHTYIQEELMVQQYTYTDGPNILTWSNLPRLTVTVHLEDPLLTPEEIAESNMLSITLESMYNIIPHMTEALSYTACTSFPELGSDTRKNVKFEMGCWTYMPDRDQTKRWNYLSNMDGRGSYTKYRLGEGTKLKHELEVDVPTIMDEESPRIEWNLMESCWMPNQGAELIFKYISKYRCWPLEILITSHKTGSKASVHPERSTATIASQESKKKIPAPESKKDVPTKDPATGDVPNRSTSVLVRGEEREVARLAAFFDVTALLRPGETKTRVVGQVFTYCQEDMTKRCGVNEVLLHLPQQNKELTVIVEEKVDVSTVLKKEKVDKKSLKEPVKANQELTESKTKIESLKEIVINPFCPEGISKPLLKPNGDPVFIIIELELWKPLTPKRSLTDIPLCIDDVLPKRPAVPKQIMTASLAGEHYKRAIATATEIIVGEYRKAREVDENVDVLNVASEEAITSELYGLLISNGTYQTVKETLRKKFALMLRENMGRGSRTSVEIQKLLPNAYIYFMEEAKIVLNSFLFPTHKGAAQPVSLELTNEQLRFFANECAGENEPEIALKHYHKTLANDVKNADNWLQYALFRVIDDPDEALECVRETLYLDSRNQIGLLMYALLLAARDRNHDADMCFRALLSFYPDFLEGWVLFHIFYLKLESHAAADAALQVAREISYNAQDTGSAECDRTLCECEESLSSSEDSQETLKEFPCLVTDFLFWLPNPYPHESIFLTTIDLLLKLNSVYFSEFALAQELIHNDVSKAYYYYLAVNHYLTGRLEDSFTHLTPLVVPDKPDYPIWILLGHIMYKMEQFHQARSYYENADNHAQRRGNQHLVNLRLGECYLHEKDYRLAKETFLKSCNDYPTPKSWLGTAIACYLLKEYHEAESALLDAIQLDSGCPIMWAYMTLINLQLHRQQEFEECFQQMMLRDMRDKYLLDKIYELKDELQYATPEARSVTSDETIYTETSGGGSSSSIEEEGMVRSGRYV